MNGVPNPSRNESRHNVFEQWNTADAVEAVRGSGPSDDQHATITQASIQQSLPSSSVRSRSDGHDFDKVAERSEVDRVSGVDREPL